MAPFHFRLAEARDSLRSYSASNYDRAVAEAGTRPIEQEALDPVDRDVPR
jgi:hypothetical protein